MIRNALYAMGHDLVVGAIVLILVCTVVLFVGAYREWRRRRRPTVTITITADASRAMEQLQRLDDALRVIGGGRRGPEPLEKHRGKVCLP